ncbi:hypothetical protein BVY02_00245 [bacterium J17]|nr:hypothetical protein BVY02_00245 [bacterium J17]
MEHSDLDLLDLEELALDQDQNDPLLKSGEKASRISTPVITSETLDRVAHLEQIISRYEVQVFTLATHLTGCEEAAKQVCETVFTRLCNNYDQYLAEDLFANSFETLIHRMTYDAALPFLVGSFNNITDRTEAIANSLSKNRISDSFKECLRDIIKETVELR